MTILARLLAFSWPLFLFGNVHTFSQLFLPLPVFFLSSLFLFLFSTPSPLHQGAGRTRQNPTKGGATQLWVGPHTRMSSWKISRLFLGLSDQGLRYGLRHGLRHGGVNSIAKRTFTATRVSYSTYRWLFLSY